MNLDGGAKVYANYWDSFDGAFRQNGVVSGCAVSQSGGITFYVGSGYYLQAGVLRQFNGSYFDIPAQDVGSNRVDTVSFSGAIAVLQTGAQVPATANPQALSSGNVLLALIDVPSGAQTMTIRDGRETLAGYGFYGDAVPTAGSTDTVLHIPPGTNGTGSVFSSGTPFTPGTGTSPYGLYGQDIAYRTSDDPTKIKRSHPQVLMNPAGSFVPANGTTLWGSGAMLPVLGSGVQTNVHIRSFGQTNVAYGKTVTTISGAGMSAVNDGDVSTAGSIVVGAGGVENTAGYIDLGADFVPYKMTTRVEGKGVPATVGGSVTVYYSGTSTAQTVFARVAGDSSFGAMATTTVLSPGSVRYIIFKANGDNASAGTRGWFYETVIWV